MRTDSVDPARASMPLSRTLLRTLLAALVVGVLFAPRAVPVAAQDVAPPDPRPEQDDWVPATLARLGGWEEERLRLAQMLGTADAEGFLLRSTSRLDRILEEEGSPESRILAPTLETVWNSDLPFSLNDGSMWAGRGLNVRVTGGLAWREGRLRVILAPELVHERNEPYQTILFRDVTARSRFAHPFHPLPESIDTPLRFGDEPRTRLHPGQSSVTLSLDPVDVGVSTENEWWGPGIRNAIVLSDHAPGFPHLFLGTTRPLETPLGAVDARWIVGRLTESKFFDLDPDNDHNSLSAIAVTLSPAFDPDLTLGFARSVIAPLDDDEIGFAAAFDAFRDAGRPQTDTTAEEGSGPDQVFSFFGRWVFPGAGFDVHGEWARFERPASFSDFLELPDHSQGWTVGVQWARPLGPLPLEGAAGGARIPPVVRIQGEITSVEPASTFQVRPAFSSYASRVVPQGYTHRGQVLGAAIGPAASSQWAAVDYLRPDWSLGGFWGRIRWDNNHLFEDPVPSEREDITVFWGLRGHVEYEGFRAVMELTTGVRVNYLYQSTLAEPGTQKRDGVDIPNETISITLSRVAGW